MTAKSVSSPFFSIWEGRNSVILNMRVQCWILYCQNYFIICNIFVNKFIFLLFSQKQNFKLLYSHHKIKAIASIVNDKNKCNRRFSSCTLAIARILWISRVTRFILNIKSDSYILIIAVVSGVCKTLLFALVWIKQHEYNL